MSRDEVLASSLEWLMALDVGLSRTGARETLRLTQAVASMFGQSWETVQQTLIDEAR